MKHREARPPRAVSRRIAWTVSLATSLSVVLAGVALMDDERVVDAASWLVSADLGERTPPPPESGGGQQSGVEAAVTDGEGGDDGDGGGDAVSAAAPAAGSWPSLRTVLQQEAREQQVQQVREQKREKKQKQAKKKRERERKQLLVTRQSAPVTLQVASFNVLGDSHTGPGGHKPGWPDAGPRMEMTVNALRSRGIDVVGFQEFEATQLRMFNARAGEYATFPGLSWGPKSVRFSIAWRTAEWEYVESRALNIPYAGGSRIDMPVVLLRHRTTGRQAWFGNFHNPADTPRLGNNAHWRNQAAAIEVATLSALHRETGHPVISTGDYNDRAGIFCRFTGTGLFRAANGGSSGGACVPPPRMQVDWIFGSANVEFSGYAVSDVGRASDHALVHASATLLPQALPDD